MLQLILLVFIYGLMMFIWTFVFLNRSHDKVNQSFLVFLSNSLVWMVLNNLSEYGDGTTITLVTKTIYWLSMMYLSITFLFFVYRLLKKKIDGWFYASFALNTLTVIVRYLYPIDYADPTFWRLSDPVVAPLMALAFSLPAIYALYLVLRQIIVTSPSTVRASRPSGRAGMPSREPAGARCTPASETMRLARPARGSTTCALRPREATRASTAPAPVE